MTFHVGMLLGGLICAASQASGNTAFEDIVIADPVQFSDLYQVSINGEPVTVQRNDGREGPLSYAHLLLSGTVSVSVSCPGAGEWRVFSAKAVNALSTSAGEMTCEIAPPAYLLIETSKEERLYILADTIDETEPDLGDDSVVSVRDHGVEGTETGLQTERIQDAIDAAAALPHGGTLYFPPGIYRTGTIRVKSGVTLYLAPRALIQGSPNPDDYPIDPGTQPRPDKTEDIRTRLILIEDAHDSGIRGRGEIDGMGQILRAERHRVPNIIRVRRSRDILIEGVTLRRAAGWNTHIFHSRGVVVRDVKILGNWSDGIDIDNSRDVEVENVLSSSYDDSFCLKATWFEGSAEEVRDIELRNALLWTMKAAMKIGTETRCRAIRDAVLENVRIAGAREAMTIKCYDGATVRDIEYSNIDYHVVPYARQAILFEIGERHGKGTIRDIEIEDLHVDAPVDSSIKGLDGEHQARDIRFEGFRISGSLIESATDARLGTNEWVNDITVE